MRGLYAAESQAVSPLLSVLTGVTFDATAPGEECCGSLNFGQVVWDRRIHEVSGVPPPMPECVRLGFGHDDRITSRLFLAVALQTVDQLMKSEGTLFSREQIQVLSRAVHPTVRLDLEGAAMYKDVKKAADEAERVRMAQEVLLKLAETGQLSDEITPLKTKTKSMSELRELLLKSYNALEPSGDHKSLFWKGMCRPLIAMSSKNQVVVGPEEKLVCGRCEPGRVVSLPAWNSVIDTAMNNKYLWRGASWRDLVPEHLRLPLKEWVAGGGAFTPGGEWPAWEDMRFLWPQEVERAKGCIQTEAKKQGVDSDEYPWVGAFLPRGECISYEDDRARDGIYATMPDHLRFWRVANLGHLIKSYRFSEEVIDMLEADATQLISSSEKRRPRVKRDYYIGSYAQAYVVLEGADSAGSSRLRLASVPYCLIAKDSKDALARQKAFWEQVKIDAGCAVSK
ncbi:hypothetical protein GNI_183010 [Gregarina niphandrodes]|uniref:Uncharacterized protein n=1 Tax=Gregarina niphandrodes TaxID=110365 RepID=A0A023AXJ4_GRENI|nr:hypothetical protein GNI_183010 [Gregarina niphandrodes]EZG43198.1 hypothetical protein GNI_183010 [Gregarina niphandrodes]|eukprot:XP_011133545.1 hypothetical protein GNI_183010 [Gregarina niphandrodes]